MATAKSGAQIVSFPTTGYYNNYNNNNSRMYVSQSLNNNSVPAREQASPEWLAIEGAYYAAIGYSMTQAIRNQIAALMEQGAAPDLIAAVLEYTAEAPRPSWAYARTVLRRQMDTGTRTAEDFQQSVEAYRRKAAERAAGPDCWSAEKGYYASRGPRRLPEQCYSQREYGPELDGPSPEDIAEAMKL